MEFINTFRKDDWTKRLSKSQFLRQKYPGRVPVIVDRANLQTPKLSDNRFIVPLETTIQTSNGQDITTSMTMGALLHIIRKHMPTLTPEQSIFMFIHEKNIMPPISATLAQIYTEHQDKSGFLLISVSVETTFGTDS